VDKIRVIELFAGMGAVHTALSRLNIDYEMVDVVEFDKKVIEAYNLIHGTNYPAQNVCEWNKDLKCDYLHASTPCQAFSVAGKGEGANDSKGRGIPLWEATINIIKKTEPKFITLENVKGLLSPKHKELVDWYINQLDQLGYKTTYKILNAKDFGVPQNRERVFFVSWKKELNFEFDWSFGTFQEKRIKDILEQNVNWFSPKEVVFLNENELIFKNEMSQYNGHIIKLNIKKALESGNRIIKCAEIQKQMWDGTIANIFESRQRIFNDNGVHHTLDSATPNQILELEPVDSHIAKEIHSENGATICINTIKTMQDKVISVDPLPFNQAKDFKNTEGVSGTLNQCHGRSQFENKVVELNPIPFMEDRHFDNKDGISGALMQNSPDFKHKLCDIDFNQMKSFNTENAVTGTLRAGDCNVCEKVVSIKEGTIRYRVLTPRECFRLMNFSDEQFDKVKHFSTSRLTKLAGNSIVVKCIEEILRKILTKDIKYVRN